MLRRETHRRPRSVRMPRDPLTSTTSPGRTAPTTAGPPLRSSRCRSPRAAGMPAADRGAAQLAPRWSAADGVRARRCRFARRLGRSRRAAVSECSPSSSISPSTAIFRVAPALARRPRGRRRQRGRAGVVGVVHHRDAGQGGAPRRDGRPGAAVPRRRQSRRAGHRRPWRRPSPPARSTGCRARAAASRSPPPAGVITRARMP